MKTSRDNASAVAMRPRVPVHGPAPHSVVEYQRPVGQRASALRQRPIHDVVEDHVVPLSAVGEVLACVVDDLVGTERSHRLQGLGTAYADDFGPQPLCDLHSEGAHAFVPDGRGSAITTTSGLCLTAAHPESLRFKALGIILA